MDTQKVRFSWVWILLLLAGFSWGVYECKYYYSKWSDYHDRPWAYSRDGNAKLLVGHWEGSFRDPDNIAKSMKLEIFEPVNEEERKAKASKRSRRGGGIRYKDKRGFDGIATVRSKLGVEEYEIYGAVEKEDNHKLHSSFRPKDEKKRVLPNFTLLEAQNGKWLGDNLTLTLTFGYNKADGSSFSSSADPRHDKVVVVTLSRQKK